MEEFISQNAKILSDFSSMSKAVGDRSDYAQGGGGNTSAKLDDRRMAIKASGYRLSDVTPDAAYAVMDYQAIREFYRTHEVSDFAEAEKEGAEFARKQILPVQGMTQLRPSVEAGFHSLLDRFVIHSHSVYANLAACTLEGKSIVEEALAYSSYKWGYVPYTDPGVRLTFTIRDELKRVTEASGKRPEVIFMQNHGLIVHHEDVKTALGIQGDVNARIANMFGLHGKSFPQINLKRLADNLFVSETPLVHRCLRSGRYGREFFLSNPLYPDQLVYLTGTLHIGETSLEPDSCLVDIDKGEILYSMNERKAESVEETIAAVIFIAEQVRKNGYTLCSMGDAAKQFIANWESESYRKNLVGNEQKNENA